MLLNNRMKNNSLVFTNSDLLKEVKLMSVEADDGVDKFLSPITIDYGMFLFPISGKATFIINAQDYLLDICSFVTILPHTTIQLKSYTPDFKCEIVSFLPNIIINADVIKEFVSRQSAFVRFPVLQLKDDEVILVQSFYNSFKLIYNRAIDACSNSLMVENLMVSFVCGVGKLYDAHADDIRNVSISRKEEILLSFTSMVLKQHTHHRKVAYYADKLCITPYYLNSICKEVKQKNASEIITEIVIQDIKVRLKTTKNTIQQIAEEMNFPNPSFFTMYFKRETGVSPKLYRNS